MPDKDKRAHWCGIGGETCCHELWCQVHEMKRAFFDTKSWFWRRDPEPAQPLSKHERFNGEYQSSFSA